MAKINARKFIENYFFLIDKKRRKIPFKFKYAQEDVYNIIKERKAKGKKSLILVLKARQLGMSTFTEALGLEQCLANDNQSMIIVTHEQRASANLYEMTHNFYEGLPDSVKNQVRIVKNNEDLMTFSNGSKIQVMVASPNSKGAGRGQTISYAHLSEFDWWNGDAPSILAGIMSACTDDAIVIIETTANGCANFKAMWDQAIKSQLDEDDEGWIPCFYAWYTDPEYVSTYRGFELTKEEEEIKEKYNLTLDQLQWRRDKIRNTFSGNLTLFHQEFPICPEEAFISSGQCIFDLNVINNRKMEIRTKPHIEDKGYYLYDVTYDSILNERKLTNIRWVSDFKNGYITKYKKPINREPYVLALDPAGNGSDYSAAQVLDNITMEQVCVLHCLDLTTFDQSAQTYCLARDYNNALVAAEVNYAPEITGRLREFGYEWLYLTQTEDTRLDVKTERRYGFRTTQVTRPYLISMLIEFINTNSDKINDYTTLLEAENFVKIRKTVYEQVKEKIQANPNSHDDLIMSLGIALYIRDSGQQRFSLYDEDPEPKAETEFDRLFGKFDFEEEKEGFLDEYI